jgi:hypothetical protein
MRNFIFILTLAIFGWAPMSALELKRVILATNDDPKYIQFWPVAARIWQAMGLRPTLALIADEDCPIDTSLGDVIRFTPLPDVPESLQAQIIRLFLPALFPDEGCLVSDIDMLPVRRSYFFDGAANCPEEAFLVYRGLTPNCEPRYPMCYIAGKGNLFGSIFGISNRQDIAKTIYEWASWGYGWNTDELLLYDFLNAWENRGGHVVRLNHEVGPRIDRDFWPDSITVIDISQYIDCHCQRPYSAHKELIDQITEAIIKQVEGSD